MMLMTTRPPNWGWPVNDRSPSHCFYGRRNHLVFLIRPKIYVFVDFYNNTIWFITSVFVNSLVNEFNSSLINLHFVVALGVRKTSSIYTCTISPLFCQCSESKQSFFRQTIFREISFVQNLRINCVILHLKKAPFCQYST